MNHLFKLAVSLLLLYFIGRSVDWAAVLLAFTSLSPWVLAAALALQLASICTAALRWTVVMRSLGMPASYFFYLASFFKGAFFNQGLPTSVGGDALRILDAARIADNKEDAVFGVLIDRLLGLAGLIVLSFGALLFGGGLIGVRAEQSLAALLGTALMGLVALYLLGYLPFFRRPGLFGLLGRLSRRLQQANATFLLCLKQSGLTLLTHLFAMASFYILALGLGLSYPFSVYLILVPPAILLTVLPISLAGWGVREGALVGLFVLIGAPRATVLTCSMLYGLSNVVVALPGLAVYLRQRAKL